MYEIKNRIYKEFDKTQKTSWCNYIRAVVKREYTENGIEFLTERVLEKFIEDERYYCEVGSSRFPFLKTVLDESEFKEDTKKYIEACLEYYKYREKQKPLIEAQKEFEKKKRRFLQEVKMSKEKPTEKQVYYYKKLCKNYDIKEKDISELSKLDIKTEIGKIIDEHTRN